MKHVTSCSHGPDQRMTASHLTTSAHQAYTFAGPSFNMQNAPDMYQIPEHAVLCGQHARSRHPNSQYHDIGGDGRVV